MEGEQFSLCWNNFHSNLSSGFHSLLKDEDLVDVTLAAEGKFIKAHKTVLSGEVSVSQEEIPTFMRVAEMLKVKGLTDNNAPSPTDTNGFTNSNRSSLGFPDQRQNIMKRPRPVKKMIRPIQHLRPIESPKLSPSPQPSPQPSHPSQPPTPTPPPPPQQPPALTQAPPPPKKPNLENDLAQIPTSTTPQPLSLCRLESFQDRLVKPKEEPVDHLDEDNTSHSGEDSHMDISHMLDTTLGGEPSPTHPFPIWPPMDFPPPVPQDSSSPGTLQCILGKRGNPRLIVDGYVFYKKSVYKGKAFWYCKNSRTPEKCQAVCWTMNGNIVKWPCRHSHPVIPDLFNPEEDTEVPIENLQEVLWQTSLN
ncbi:hypothetical protein JTB14_025879 [Gonioctena quinquepunctata]|nr:hypothetical protein JTB14_025879 [Gonioctena quinquepunctata]